MNKPKVDHTWGGLINPIRQAKVCERCSAVFTGDTVLDTCQLCDRRICKDCKSGRKCRHCVKKKKNENLRVKEFKKLQMNTNKMDKNTIIGDNSPFISMLSDSLEEEESLDELAIRNLPTVAKERARSIMKRLPKSQRDEILAHVKTYGLTPNKAKTVITDLLDKSARDSGIGPMSAVEQGNNWYFLANKILRKIAREYGVSDDIVAGVAAVTSPRMRWENDKGGGPNANVTRMILKSMSNVNRKINIPGKGDVEISNLTSREIAKHHPDIKGVFKRGAEWAIDVIRGKPVKEVTKGHKINSFYHNLLDPSGSKHTTIDTWMIRGFTKSDDWGLEKGKSVSTLLSQPSPKTGRGARQQKVYKEFYAAWTDEGAFPFFQDVIAQVAKERGMKPHQVQAIVWMLLKHGPQIDISGTIR